MTAVKIAAVLHLARSTVARLLQRNGIGRLRLLEPKLEPRSYEWPRPGDMLHVDTKKLARIGRPGHRIHGDRSQRFYGIGWEYVHVALDDHTRLAYAEVLRDEKANTAIAFLRRARDWYARRGIEIQRVLSDNGSCYKKRFTDACAQLGIWHLRTMPYTPRTNGKAERLNQTLLREWAYVKLSQVAPAGGSSATVPALLQPQAAARRMRRAHAAEEAGARRMNNVMRNDDQRSDPQRRVKPRAFVCDQ